MTNPPDKQREYTKRWYLKHGEQARLKKRLQRHKTDFGGNRELVLARDENRCVECGSKQDITVDHIDQDRTNNSFENLQTLCRPCHGRKDGQTRRIKSGWKWNRRDQR